MLNKRTFIAIYQKKIFDYKFGDLKMMQDFSYGTVQVDPENLVCPKTQKVSLLCATKSCNKYALVCCKQSCQCNSQNQHGSCVFVLASKLIKSMQAKRGVLSEDIQKAFESIDSMYLNAIQALSEDRQKMYIMRNNYGLSEEEGKVLTYLHDENKEKLTGDLVFKAKQCQTIKSSNLQITKQSVDFFWEKYRKQFDTMLAKMRNVIHQNKIGTQFQILRQEIDGKFMNDELIQKAIKMFFKIKKNTSSMIFREFNKRIKIWWSSLKNDKSDVYSYLSAIIPQINQAIQDLIAFQKNPMNNPENFIKKLGIPQNFNIFQAEIKFAKLIQLEQANLYSSKPVQHDIQKTESKINSDAAIFIKEMKKFWSQNSGQMTEKIFASVHKNDKMLGKKLRKHFINPQRSAVFLVGVLSQGEKLDLANVLLNCTAIATGNDFGFEMIELNKMLEPLVRKVWYDQYDES